MKKQQERKGLAITGLIIAILALIGSWVPIINNISFIFAVIALIFGLIALYINRKGKKTITIIAIALSVASGAIVLLPSNSIQALLTQHPRVFRKVLALLQVAFQKMSQQVQAHQMQLQNHIMQVTLLTRHMACKLKSTLSISHQGINLKFQILESNMSL